LLRLAPRLKVFLSASAVGYYGNSGEKAVTEASPSGQGFLPKVCRAWEAEALKAPSSVRKVILRSGVVLSPGEGFLSKLEPLFRNGLGAAVGTGHQSMSWIHL